MPPSRSHGFRFYVDQVGDRKIRRLTRTQRWIWCAILRAARESPVPGRLLITEDPPTTYAELASYADVKGRDIEPAVALIAQFRTVHFDGE
jgi:hypothetical protein